ncbi:helix-turn-helix domain-containing protein [Nocardia sp. NPDC051030]|uniref:winged helix-turn-helix transcriptional regulator n=1 Tax=Nocardia sp. NPDC051030 TaxID=3155162 RepID=UPI00342A0E54
MARNYAQYCAIARSLDVVGERWALLVVRELVDGPRRYTDLLAGIPGVTRDMLADRLRNLERDGVIHRAALPDGSKGYELSDLGQELGPVLLTLTKWGLRVLGEQHEEDSFQARWLIHPLRAAFRRERAGDGAVTIRFDTGEQHLDVAISAGELSIVETGLEAPEVLVTATAQTLAESWSDPAAQSDGRLRFTGSPEAIRKIQSAFGFPAA